ncbi:hypothetical protein ABEB36_010912 [Hypothenemus hampei]|uniref:Elongation factor-like GTPase 1 domain-containing protein n=1 Tax=Hypothenemus hampei TaxID=57062 RepID=A0ABD1EDH2_HYPHA
MILVINKIDRLVLDLKLSLEGMFQRINKIIETCNAFIAELYQYSDSGCTKLEETGLLFLPPTGNVIFASALHGWSFTTKLIADKMFSNVEGEIDEEALNEKIWNFDLWLDSKKNIKTGAINKGKSNLFIQLCLQPVYHVYHTLGIKLDKDKAQSIIDKLGIEKIPGITLNSNETINQIKAIMAAWQPFDLTVLLQIQCIFPCPVNITQQKIDYLLNAHRYIEDPYLNRCISNITTGFQKHFVIQPIICYVAKTFCVNIKNLTYTMQLQRRFQPRIYPRKTTTITKRTTTPQDTPVDSDNSLDKKIKEIADEIVVMALTKIYIGKLFVGKELYVLQQGYVPNQHELMTNCDDFVASNPYIHKVVIKELFIFVGKHLHSVDQVPAGNICAIKITDEKMVKGVTLSSILEMVPLIEHPSLPPVVKYAIEPVNPRELSILRHGLKLLTLSDPCVQVKTQENGEMVMLTAGDLHQEKCIEDLTRHFAKIELKVSDPIVSLRETVKNTIEEPFQYASVKTPYMDLSVTVVSLPKEIAKVIQDNYDLFETVEEIEKCSIFDIIRMFQNPPERREVQIKTFTNETINRAVKKLLKDLADASSMCGSNWTLLINRIWSVSKTRDSPNLLLNNCSDLSLSIFMETDFWDKRSIMARYISTAYQTFLKAGPICEEPISHCAFIINSFNLLKDLEAGDINAQVIAFEDIAVRNAFKEAFQKRDQRIMDPVYNTNIRLSMAVETSTIRWVNMKETSLRPLEWMKMRKTSWSRQRFR